jgi:hypothetical protein
VLTGRNGTIRLLGNAAVKRQNLHCPHAQSPKDNVAPLEPKRAKGNLDKDKI